MTCGEAEGGAGGGLAPAVPAMAPPLCRAAD
jgi:hypothetical protein